MNNLTPDGPIGIPPNEFYAYELTETDLKFTTLKNEYSAGQVLFFKTNDSRQIDLGKEIGKADNRKSASQYLKSKTGSALGFFNGAAEHADASTESFPISADSAEATTRSQTDNVQDIIDGLNSKIVLLEALVSVLASRNDELFKHYQGILDNIQKIDDQEYGNLQQRFDDYTKQTTVEAENLRQLLDAQSSNIKSLDDQIVSLKAELLLASVGLVPSTTPDPDNTAADETVTQIASTEKGRVYSTSAGTVTIYHEFPKPVKPSLPVRIYAFVRSKAWTLFVLLTVLWVIYTTSMFDSMKLSGVPVDEYSKAFFERIKGFFGF